MLLRSMAPAVIAVDELGECEEIELIQQMTGNGCAVIATIHGENLEEVQNKEILKLTQTSDNKTITSLGDVQKFLKGFDNGVTLQDTLDSMNQGTLRFESTGQINS